MSRIRHHTQRFWVSVLCLVGCVTGSAWLAPTAAQEKLPRLSALQDREARRRTVEELGRSGDERQVAPLLEALRSDRDFLVRSAAAEALGNLKSELALNGLIAALGDVSPDVRAAAALALGRLGRPQAAMALRPCLRDGEPTVRGAVAVALGKLGDATALPALIELLSDVEAEVRASAAEGLGALGRSEAVEPLLHALDDTNLYVRSRAATALGMIGDTRAVDGVIGLLRDPERTVRASAAEALSRLRDRRAVLPLLDALRDREPVVRQNAAFALSKIGDAIAADGLTDALRDEDARVRARAVDALGVLAIPRTLDAVVDGLRDGDPLVRTFAVQALGNFTDDRAIEALVETLSADDPLLRRRAVESLAKIGDARTLPSVQTALADPNPLVRAAAVAALPRIGGTRTLPLLLDALQADDLLMRNAAAFALARLGAEEAFTGVVETVGNLSAPNVLDRRTTLAGFFNAVADAVPKLETLLRAPEPLRRRGALLTLALVIKSPQAAAELLTALDDPDPGVRQAAVFGLAQTDPARLAQEATRRLLQESDPSVRSRWLSLLPTLRDAPPEMATVLRRLARADVSPEVRQAAVTALDRLRLPRVVLPAAPPALPLVAERSLLRLPDVKLLTAVAVAPPPAPILAQDLPRQTSDPMPVSEPMPDGPTTRRLLPAEVRDEGQPTRSVRVLPRWTGAARLPVIAAAPLPPEPLRSERTPFEAGAPPPSMPNGTEPARTSESLAVDVRPMARAISGLAPARGLPMRRSGAPSGLTWPMRTSFTWAMSADERIRRAEAAVVKLLTQLVAAQANVAATSGGAFATLTQLRAQRLLPENDLAAMEDYRITLYVTEATAAGPAEFFALALPAVPGLTGRQVFYVDASGIIRSALVERSQVAPFREWEPVSAVAERRVQPAATGAVRYPATTRRQMPAASTAVLPTPEAKVRAATGHAVLRRVL